MNGKNKQTVGVEMKITVDSNRSIRPIADIFNAAKMHRKSDSKVS